MAGYEGDVNTLMSLTYPPVVQKLGEEGFKDLLSNQFEKAGEKNYKVRFDKILSIAKPMKIGELEVVVIYYSSITQVSGISWKTKQRALAMPDSNGKWSFMILTAKVPELYADLKDFDVSPYEEGLRILAHPGNLVRSRIKWSVKNEGDCIDSKIHYYDDGSYKEEFYFCKENVIQSYYYDEAGRQLERYVNGIGRFGIEREYYSKYEYPDSVFYYSSQSLLESIRTTSIITNAEGLVTQYTGPDGKKVAITYEFDEKNRVKLKVSEEEGIREETQYEDDIKVYKKRIYLNVDDRIEYWKYNIRGDVIEHSSRPRMKDIYHYDARGLLISKESKVKSKDGWKTRSSELYEYQGEDLVMLKRYRGDMLSAAFRYEYE
ncbi:hypothetical protein [Ekhidna sp.]